MSTTTSEEKKQVKIPNGSTLTLDKWQQTFYLYSYCFGCPGTNGAHVAKDCLCGCHVIAMFRWIEGNAKHTSLENIAKYIERAEAAMLTAHMPIRSIDELRKIREQAIIDSGSKPL